MKNDRRKQCLETRETSIYNSFSLWRSIQLYQYRSYLYLQHVCTYLITLSQLQSLFYISFKGTIIVNGKLDGCERKRSLTNIWYYPSICLEGPRKNKELRITGFRDRARTQALPNTKEWRSLNHDAWYDKQVMQNRKERTIVSKCVRPVRSLAANAPPKQA
jgi:hypothetical protein